MSRTPQPAACSLACALLLFLPGCVRRSLTIRTNPPGALVYVNDQLKGPSPVTYDFEWYGWHRVMVRKDGYERIEDRKILRSPAYLWIPFDLAMELLPFTIHDDRTWDYTLSPAAVLPAPVPPHTFTVPPAPARPQRPSAPPPAASAAEGKPADAESLDDLR